jgi:tRNA G10  N-methylase Trm11
MSPELIKIASLGISFVGLVITLYIVNRNSIKRSNERASEHTRINLKILEIEKDILEMKTERTELVSEMRAQREKDIDSFSKLVDRLDKRYETMMFNFKKDNKADHKELFDLNRKQTGIMSTMAAGVARIDTEVKIALKAKTA